jgi:hypothetical protein
MANKKLHFDTKESLHRHGSIVSRRELGETIQRQVLTYSEYIGILKEITSLGDEYKTFHTIALKEPGNTPEENRMLVEHCVRMLTKRIQKNMEYIQKLDELQK